MACSEYTHTVPVKDGQQVVLQEEGQGEWKPCGANQEHHCPRPPNGRRSSSKFQSIDGGAANFEQAQQLRCARGSTCGFGRSFFCQFGNFGGEVTIRRMFIQSFLRPNQVIKSSLLSPVQEELSRCPAAHYRHHHDQEWNYGITSQFPTDILFLIDQKCLE